MNIKNKKNLNLLHDLMSKQIKVNEYGFDSA